MRSCLRCQAEMIPVNDSQEKVRGFGIGFRSKAFMEALNEKSENIKAMVCPACGEMSWYMEDTSKIQP